jgi:hypothetical protein
MLPCITAIKGSLPGWEDGGRKGKKENHQNVNDIKPLFESKDTIIYEASQYVGGFFSVG